MIKRNNLLLFACIAIVFFMTVSVASAGFLDFLFPPSKANADDEIFEAIGGDEFLNVTLKGCVKVSEENIPDGAVETSLNGNILYYDAKNITYVDTDGNRDYFIVWKTTPDKYAFFNTSQDVNLYLSDYLKDGSGKLFLESSYEDKYAYGIILGTNNMSYSEADLIYDVLGLNKTGFSLSYSGTQTSSSSSSGSGSHYHTVVSDRYTLAHSDPDSYYDHYEYGDDPNIDDYLEVEGYD